ncbi:MAG: RNA polymerase sigma factor [Verrucomicrobiota bacterium]|jgi:RNA polymerase sigma-70 factor (ECF subfamily)|nr:RNA polymerase sigma factor [Verrucomicrobiota bacterium]
MDRKVERMLIKRCLQGEKKAWDELFDLHYGPTSRFVYQLSSDYTIEDCEEICQEAFLSIIKNLGSFSGRSALQTWIFRIAANKARDYRSKQMAAKRGGGQAAFSLQAEDEEGNRVLDPPSPRPAPDGELMQGEQWKLLADGLERLGGPCQEILELRYFGDLPYHEIGKTLNLNEKTVSSRLSKCRDKLEKVMREIFSREKLGPARLNNRS